MLDYIYRITIRLVAHDKHLSSKFLMDFETLFYTDSSVLEKKSFEETLRNKDVLDGFRRGSASVLPKTNYPPPQLPRDFRPFHKFEPSVMTSAKKETVVKSSDGATMNAFSRGELLGERPHLR